MFLTHYNMILAKPYLFLLGKFVIHFLSNNGVILNLVWCLAIMAINGLAQNWKANLPMKMHYVSLKAYSPKNSQKVITKLDGQFKSHTSEQFNHL